VNGREIELAFSRVRCHPAQMVEEFDSAVTDSKPASAASQQHCLNKIPIDCLREELVFGEVTLVDEGDSAPRARMERDVCVGPMSNP
jgi:hypothetical protein